MSHDVRLSSRLAKDPELNGLDGLAAELMEDPDQVLCCLAWVKVTKITNDLPEGHTYPTVQIARIEPIGAPTEIPPAVVQLALQMFEQRLGKTALPIDELDVVEGAWPQDKDDE